MGATRAALDPDGQAALTCYTKWCPQAKSYTEAEVAAAVQRSLSRMQTPCLDLLQLHWWDYAARGELEGVLRSLVALQQRGRLRELGLTNFDTAHVVWMVDELKIPIASNQVQYSLVDTRPRDRMAAACQARGVKLLCYGTLLGGLLTDRYLGKAEPQGRAELSTPSLGKYYNMVRHWGGWGLFQELLRACRSVADRHGASIATVALAWVLRQEAVAGVIVGLRAGLSEHAAENRAACALSEKLTPADLAEIAAVQAKGRDLLGHIGDCGDEYR
jgi:aryl-alcohol dehydrogenase-like predicted oxidoreductase